MILSATVYLPEIYQKIDKYYMQDMDVFPRRPIELIDVENSDPNQDRSELIGNDLPLCINDLIHAPDGNVYKIIDIVGSGSFARVYKASIVGKDGLYVAMKFSKCVPRLVRRIENEFYVMNIFSKGPDMPGKEILSKVYSYFKYKDHACIVLDLYQRTLLKCFNFESDLAGLLNFLHDVMSQTLHALHYIHSLGYVHCDLKPDNIMLCQDCSYNIRIIDFGSTRQLQKEKIEIPQPICYRSPERILNLPLDEKIDIWSIGCIAAEIILGFPVFACENECDVLYSIIGLIGNIPEEMLLESPVIKTLFKSTPRGPTPRYDPRDVLNQVNYNHEYLLENSNLYANIMNRLDGVEGAEVVADFVLCLLEINPDKRLSAKEALRHPFITREDKDWKQKSCNITVPIACSTSLFYRYSPDFYDMQSSF